MISVRTVLKLEFGVGIWKYLILESSLFDRAKKYSIVINLALGENCLEIVIRSLLVCRVDICFFLETVTKKYKMVLKFVFWEGIQLKI